MTDVINRRLAAIMFTDIVGYTSLMQEDETAARAIRQRHRNVFQKEHEKHQGEIIQYYGDGTLSVFKSAVDAVKCAIVMQQQFKIGLVVPLRIGIHLGEIVFDVNEIFGDGVNLASRIEALGISGSILLSDKLNYAIKNQQSIDTKSVGTFELKNINDPVEVFAVSNNGIRIPARAELKGKLKENKKSIAVLPFVNMSSDPENEYFSDGISEEILNALVKVDGLKVTARTSSFMFKGKNMDVREIGTQLGVQHILEGSVRKMGNRVRITAQLVSTVDGYHFFSENYDRTLEDIFVLQDEIASAITNRLREHLGESEHKEHLVVAPTLNIEAYETYLRGLYYFYQFGDDEAMSKAIPFFIKAIEMQEDFGLPHSRMAISYLFMALGGKITLEEGHEKAMKHIDCIKNLGTETPEAYFALGVFEVFYQWDWSAAVKTVKKGLELFPSYSSLYHMVSTLYYIKGKPIERIESHKIGLELDPLSLEMILYMGIAHFWNGEIEQSIPFLDKTIEMLPNHRAAWEYKGWVAAFQEQYEEALKIFIKLEPAGYRLHRSTCLGWVYHKMGDKRKAESCLKELIEMEKHAIRLAIDLATLYTCFEDFDMAFLYLKKCIQNKIGDSMMFKENPFFKPLFNDPRHLEIEALIGEVPDIDFYTI